MDIYFFIQIYLAILLATIIHEFFHFGKMKINFLIPNRSSSQLSSHSFAWVPLFIEILGSYLIFIIKPSYLFFNLLGFFLIVHFLYQMIYSGFFDNAGGDIMKHNIIYAIIGVLALVYFFGYYYQYGLLIFNKVMEIDNLILKIIVGGDILYNSK